MTTSDRIRILLVRRGNMSMSELARRLGVTPQNLNKKIRRNNFKEADLQEIAEALDCEFTMTFKLRDTGEII